MTKRDWRIFREDFSIAYKGSRIPRPMQSWSESNLKAELLDAVAAAGYQKPSPIQMAAIPLSLSQRDVIGIAETGSGKTAAFVLPMLSLFARWFQPAQTNQPIVFSSHKKPAPASPNQHQHQPANRVYT